MDKVILEAKNISKSFSNGEKKLNVLKNLSLLINQGDIIIIMGESGSGKSTALNILGTLDKPDDGFLEIDSQQIINFDDNEISKIRNEKIGFVFQSSYLLPEFTALENVLMPAWIRKKNNFEQRAINIFEYLGIADKMNYFPNQLSGGEKARIAFIRATINNPKILFADEPTGNLDRNNAKRLLKFLKKFNQDFNQTIVLTTHSTEVSKFGHKIFMLDNGVLNKK